VSLVLVPYCLYNFISTWISINRTVKGATIEFYEELRKAGFSKEAAERLAKRYASAKDRLFERLFRRGHPHTLKRSKTQGDNESVSFRNIFVKMLPVGQLVVSRHSSALVSDMTKTIILVVGISRALERDVYWVFVCIVSYVMFAFLFGLTSQLVEKHRNVRGGLLGSALDALAGTFSDTKAMAAVALALSSHAILGAPFIPLYHVIPNLDILEHYISGVGVGLLAIKAYRTFISYVSYSKTLIMFNLHKMGRQVSLFEARAELPFVCYSALFASLMWEGLEEIVENFTPRVVNVFFWNGVADIFVGLLGAITAYVLVTRFGFIKKLKTRARGHV
jgi:hypothetical protein